MHLVGFTIENPVVFCTKLIQYSQYLNVKIKILPQGSHFDGNINTVHFPSLSHLPNSITHFPALYCYHHSRSLFHSSLAGSQKSKGLADQALRICSSAKNFLIMLHVLTFRHRASCILGKAFHYYPENAFYIFNQQINFIT